MINKFQQSTKTHAFFQVKMKRETKSEPTGTPPKKKLKKSVKINSQVEVKTFSSKDRLQPKNQKTKPDKKPKFEKSIQKKKPKPDSEEPSGKLVKIKKFAEKLTKKNRVKSKDTETNPKIKSENNSRKNLENGQSSQEGETEKPDWNEIKKQRKEMKKKRKEQKLKDFYPKHSQVLKLSEKLRRDDLPLEERKDTCEKIHLLLKGTYNQTVNTHDISRVIQWLLKLSSQEIRDEILRELEPSWKSMFFSKYAKKCLVSACEHCSKDIQKSILDVTFGEVIRILSSAETSRLFEKLFSQYATAEQKVFFKQEFFGDLYKGAKDPKVKCLEDVFKDDPVMKTATLSAVKANLTRILNKQLVNSSLVHQVLYEYLCVCSSEDRSEMIQQVREMSLQLTESKAGSKAGVICIWHGTNKDRKVIMKSLKEHLKDVFLSEHGHLMLMALIDCVDDTILLKKVLLAEMTKDLKEIAVNEFGRKVLLYLVARRVPKFFHPAEINFFKQGDGNAFSKKPAEIREKELLDHVIDGFLEAVKEDVGFWLASGPIQTVTYAILNSNHDRDLTAIFEAIVGFVLAEESVLKDDKGKDVPAVEHAGLHATLKKIIQAEQRFREKNEKSSICKVVVGKLDEKIVRRLIECNRGCFLLVLTAENGGEDVVMEMKEKLDIVKGELEKKKTMGAGILVKKVWGE